MLLWTQGCMYLFGLQFYLDICPAVGLLDHTETLVLVFWGPSILLSIVVAPACIPTHSARGCLCLTASSACIVCRRCGNGHSDWHAMMSQCSFDLHFSNNEQWWAPLSVPVGHLRAAQASLGLCSVLTSRIPLPGGSSHSCSAHFSLKPYAHVSSVYQSPHWGLSQVTCLTSWGHLG